MATRGPARSSRHRRLVARAFVAFIVTMALLVTPAGVASADEEESDMANLLTLQSVALIANGAPADRVVERIQDAVAAPDQSGTDTAKVRQALDLARRGSAADLQQARALLVSAIDLRFASGYGEIPGPSEVGRDQSPYATGAQTGTTAVLDELAPAPGISDRGDIVLLILAVLAMAAGLVLARRWRPPDTIRELRQRTVQPERS